MVAAHAAYSDAEGLTELQIILHGVYHVRAVHSYSVIKSGLGLNVERGAHACHDGCERE